MSSGSGRDAILGTMVLHPFIEEWDTGLRSGDPLGFPGYADRLATRSGESVRTGRTEHAVLILSDFDFFGGSMGVVHGTKVVRAVDRAIALGLPVVVEVRSGGARMQEGMVSLIQMGRVAAAMGRLRDAGLASVAVLRHPTTGGVMASYASLCDVVGAEAGGTIGFAGPRVAEAMTAEPMAGRSHTAETAFAAGLVDFVGRRGRVAHLDRSSARPRRHRRFPTPPLPRGRCDGRRRRRRPRRAGPRGAVRRGTRCSRARDPGRPTRIDVAAALVASWTELAGTDPTMPRRPGHDRRPSRRGRRRGPPLRHGPPGPSAFRLVRRGGAHWPIGGVCRS